LPYLTQQYLIVHHQRRLNVILWLKFHHLAFFHQ
jgi:hypothetical protein